MTWVYKMKRDGTQKAHLCMQGCSQVHSVDYDQVWSGSLRASSPRVLASLAAKEKLNMRRWDFVAAYLQGELLVSRRQDRLYVSMPKGYYGTRQASTSLTRRGHRPPHREAHLQHGPGGTAQAADPLPLHRHRQGFTTTESDPSPACSTPSRK